MPTQWEYGAVAFLDVLGFAHFVEADAASASPRHLDRLLDCLAEVRATTAAGRLDLRSFSDSIVISANLTAEATSNLLLSVVGLQRIFIRRAVLVRGAVAFGKHYSDSESVYSEALVRAYTLERKSARFPRVVVDANLLDCFMNDSDCTAELREQVIPLLLHDRDGQTFCHYLTATLLEAHADLVTSYESNRITPSVLEKVQWLAAYHNYVADSIQSPIRIDGPLVAGFQGW